MRSTCSEVSGGASSASLSPAFVSEAMTVDLGVVDRCQQHEIPLVTVTVTQYDQHAVACSCGKVHTAARPSCAGSGRVEYGPNLRAYAVYLLVVHFVPVHRVAEILTSLTGAEPSAGSVHSLLRRAARALAACDFAIRTLITLAFAVCADETPLKVGPATPAEGQGLSACRLHRPVHPLPARRPVHEDVPADGTGRSRTRRGRRP
jgi:transposase